ncbi:hypothetical protein PIB30_033496 [Stylosanthes scabra]|uniref:Leucine-rich repeat-containing N-terminal plant-type domain-containing protein n=1 Tax=Stylosanthes scabra TaxID=79078 RepID=A0ABU6ZA44_9FABA|nr:hypothetical protein [Stylosanthes scabra]
MRISFNTFVFVLLLLFTITANLGCIEQERQALLIFKTSLHSFFTDDDPSSPPIMLPSWQGHECCKWEGIACNNVTAHVTKIEIISSSSLSSSEEDATSDIEPNYDALFPDLYVQHLNLNQSLLHFKHLIHLDLSGVSLGSSPINFLGSMRKLRYLSLCTELQGMIPSSIGNLTDLRVLRISSFHEAYSHDLIWVAQLSSLQYLAFNAVNLSMAHNLFQVLNMLPSLSQIHLFDCELGNMPIPLHPISLMNLTNVQVLNLASNSLHDQVLDAFRNMTSVRFFDISQNSFTSLPQWFDKLNKLVGLYLARNRFSGRILPNLENMTFIRDLDLSDTNLCSVPSWLSKCKSLVKLGLGCNFLRGPIPYALRNLTSLTVLDLSDNNLTSIPTWLGELKSLIRLDLESNNVTSAEEGSLASILGNMCHLKGFYLSGYKLQGEVFPINSNISSCKNYDLEELDLSNNNFSDKLPIWLEKFKSLSYLDLSSNSFSGSILHILGEMVNLTYLDLSSNFFNGVIHWNLGNLEKLEYLVLSSNLFTGVIPRSLGKLENAAFMSLACNQLHGNIPHSLGKLKNLYSLNLSSNSLEGTISHLERWSAAKSLHTLSLSNNQINGSIPENLDEIIPELRYLELDNNHIEGSIPDSFCKLKAVVTIDLSNNKLSGVIPTSIMNMTSLVWLHLNNNSLHGELPLFINLKKLLILDLGENRLSGAIPSWKNDTFPELQILRLRGNMFNGTVPSNLCQFSKLQVLDLAKNSLRGSIPHCIGNITGMAMLEAKIMPNGTLVNATKQWNQEDVKQVIKGRELDYTKNLVLLTNLDLSDNRFDGSIPKELSSLSGLLGLNLSYNDLSGEIPEMIGDMRSLESVDFSHNKLFGAIPSSMSSLTFLSHLNLSNNNFSGPIPRGNQFQVLDDPLIYSGNPYLCGVPVKAMCPGDTDTDDSHEDPEGYEDEDGENDKLDKILFYFVIALGFATGFWGIIGVLYVKKNWRYACFGYVDEVADRIYVAIVLKVAKLKNKLRRR